MTNHGRHFGAILAVCAATTQLQAEQPIDLILPFDQMPFVDLAEDNALQGVIGETANALLNQMGYTPVPLPASTRYIHEMIDTAQAHIALGVHGTEDRVGEAHYSDPIISEQYVLVAKTDMAAKLTNLADLNGRRLGAVTGSTFPVLEDYNVELEFAYDHEINVQKVIAGDIDAAIVPFITFAFPSEDTEFFAELQIIPYALETVPLGIALADECFAESEIEQFNTLLEQFILTDQFAQIMAFHGLANIERPTPMPSERPILVSGPR